MSNSSGENGEDGNVPNNSNDPNLENQDTPPAPTTIDTPTFPSLFPQASASTLPSKEIIREEKLSEKLPPKLMTSAQWPLWSLKMKLHLKSQGVWDIVSGSRSAPAPNADPKDLRTFAKDKSKAHSDLLKCLGPTFENLAATFENAKEVWDCLKEVCCQSESTQLLAVQQLIDKLSHFEPLSMCLLEFKRLELEVFQF